MITFKVEVEQEEMAAGLRGYAGSSRIDGPVGLGDQVGHLRALMRHIRIERAHFVGHSSSGNIVLQAAVDAPHLVHSLALLELALLGVPSGPQVAKAVLVPAVERYRAGGTRRGPSIPSCRESPDRATA